MRTIDGVGVCLACAALSLGAQADETATLMDQIGPNSDSSVDSSNSYTNQLFETALNVYDVAAIDDFDNSDGSTIYRVETVITGWNGYSGLDGIQGVQVNFHNHFSDVAESGLKGYVTEDLMATPVGNADWTGPGALIAATTESGWVLEGGTQYVSLTPFNEFGTNGQVAVLGSTVGNGVAWQANPEGGFGMGPYWEIAANLAYRVTGTGSADCNENGIPDGTDIADGTSADLNGNGTPDECECPDVNGDGQVNVNDMLAVLESWGDCPAEGSCSGDVNYDSSVNVNDALLVISRWGECQ